MKRVFGGLMLLMGVALACWVGYNLFVEVQPEAEGRNPLPAILFCAGLLFVGTKWVKE